MDSHFTFVLTLPSWTPWFYIRGNTHLWNVFLLSSLCFSWGVNTIPTISGVLGVAFQNGMGGEKRAGRDRQTNRQRQQRQTERGKRGWKTGVFSLCLQLSLNPFLVPVTQANSDIVLSFSSRASKTSWAGMMDILSALCFLVHSYIQHSTYIPICSHPLITCL